VFFFNSLARTLAARVAATEYKAGHVSSPPIWVRAKIERAALSCGANFRTRAPLHFMATRPAFANISALGRDESLSEIEDGMIFSAFCIIFT